ncbi:unnamed protein product, partial [marine sediment metagenome]
ALVVVKWWQALQKEDSKQQKKNPIGYRFFLEDYAKHFRDRVSRLQYDIAIKRGG